MAVPSAARYRGILSDISGTVTTGGTAKLISAQNANRNYLLIQNLHGSADLWVNFGVAATTATPSLKLAAGAVLAFEATFVPTDSVSVVSNTSGHPFAAKEG